ncbi:MAG: hypothetical protein ACI8PZ_006079 [Myxococcota bacterium]|jgi:hypothetical protein
MPPRRAIVSAYGLFVLLTLWMVAGPGFMWWGNRVEPFVLGLPFVFAWVVGWVVASFLGLLALHLTAGGEDR